MKSRLQRIEIHNFKAFRDFTLNLEGRHLLVYGPNGSGKSSLYWALYTFLQSARKRPKHAIAKYFEPAESENLLNIHEDATTKPGEIALTLRDTTTRNDTTYRISQADHETFDKSVILKADRASDFITYRFVFRFADFKNSQAFDFWELFEREILPFCRGVSGEDLYAEWLSIVENPPHNRSLIGGAVKKARDEYDQRVAEFNSKLNGVVSSIGDAAESFYDDYFREDDPGFKFKIGFAKSANYDRDNKKLMPPILKLEAQAAGSEAHRPHVFLNEAKLTQLALSVRFAASLVNLHDSDLKLLVLDDLLVSLDMSNRMKVVEILLSEQFDNYQKIILTHDLGFFREFQRLIDDELGNWCVRTLKGNARTGITAEASKSPIEKARQYINGHDLEEAALQLRKAAEETAKRYRRFAMGQTPRPGEFHSLSEDLKAARKHLEQQLPMALYKRVIKGTPEEHRDKLVCASDADLDADTSLDPAARGKLKAQRRHLRQFLSDTAWQQAQAMETIDAVIRMKDRVLNPAAHWGDAPLYQAELDKALKLVARLEKILR